MISPVVCKHERASLLRGANWVGSGGAGHEAAYLCPDCGEFTVHIAKDGGPNHSMKFCLMSEEVLNWAAQSVHYYTADRGACSQCGSKLHTLEHCDAEGEAKEPGE